MTSRDHRGSRISAWDMVDQKLRGAGVAPQQVQVAFVELTRIDEPVPPFPTHAQVAATQTLVREPPP